MRQIALCLIFILSLFVCVDGVAQKRKKNNEQQSIEYNVCNIPDGLSIEERIPLLFDFYNQNTLNEKLYVHTDKESCLAGDTIWFKAYMTSAVTNMPCDYSRFMYIDIVDRSDSIYYKEMFSRLDSEYTYSGNIPLSEDLRQGEYYIRAYTYWQQNQDEAFIYKKRIRIINPFDHQIKSQINLERNSSNGKRVISVSFVNHLNEKYTNVDFYYKIPSPNGDNNLILANTGYNGTSRITIDDSLANKIYLKFSYASSWDYEGYQDIPASRVDFDVQFFPEGGTLITNKLQRVAFKSVGRDGKAIPVVGAIYEGDKEIVTFSSNKLGMGTFIINTGKFSFYKAIVTHESGIKKEFRIPVSESGISIQVVGVDDQAQYSIINSNDFDNILDDCNVVVHSRGLLLAQLEAKKFNDVQLNLSNAPTGILHFALYHKPSGKILSNRLWYHHKSKTSDIDITVSEVLNSGVRHDQPIFMIYSNDKDDMANISVTVINTGQGIIDTDLGGIEAYQLLTSDLKGYVENPGYYFNDSNSTRVQDLDALLLTQGWSRFDVESIMNESFLIHNAFYMERGQFVSGRVKSLIGDKPLQGAKVVLLSSNGIARSTNTDSLGMFFFDNIHYEANTSFVVQASETEKRLQIEISRPEYRPYSLKIPYLVFSSDKDFYNRYSKDYVFLDNGERINTLGTVSVKNYTRKTDEMIMKDSLEKQARRNFLLGYTDVVNYGGLPLLYSVDGSILYRGNRPLDKPAQNSAFTPGFNYSVGANYLSATKMKEFAKIAGHDYYLQLADKVEQSVRVNEAENLKSGDYLHPVRMLNADAGRLLGNKVQIYGQNIFYPNNIYQVWAGGVVDNTRKSSLEICWDKQIFVPYAPQEHVEFYKPTYVNIEEEQKPIVDEIITRYWNPDIRLKSGEEFSFTFPAVRDGENSRYLMVIEGLTESGEPIYKYMNL